MPHQKVVERLQHLYSDIVAQEKNPLQTPLINQILQQDQKIGLLFAGQGFDFMTELSELYEYSPAAKEWILHADALLSKWTESTEILSKAMFSFGLHLNLRLVQLSRANLLSIPTSNQEGLSF